MRTRALLLAGASAVLALSSCSEAPPPATTQPPAPNTGYIAFAVVNGRPLIFTPAEGNPDGWTPIAVLDALAPAGQDGLIKYVDLGPTAVPSAVGADAHDVVVADGDNPTVYFIDAASQLLTGSAALPQGDRFFVSGTNLYSAGVAVDSARRRAWASYSGGVAEYDLDTRLLTATYVAPPSENFTYDRVAGLLYLPFYLCDPNGTSGGLDPFAQTGGPAITDSVAVVNLATGTTSLLVDPSAADTHAPLGFEPDAAALDPNLKLLAIASGNPSAVKVLSAAPVFDDATPTCRMPLTTTIPLPPDEYSAITLDPASHVAAVAQEGGAGLAFADLTGTRPWPGNLLSFFIPDLPDGEPWATRVDPHGVTVGVISGRTYLFVSHINRRWIARVEVAKIAALTSEDQAAFVAALSTIQVPATPTR